MSDKQESSLQPFFHLASGIRFMYFFSSIFTGFHSVGQCTAHGFLLFHVFLPKHHHMIKDENVELTVEQEIPNIDGKDVAEGTVIPTESEFGCTNGDKDKSRIINSEDTRLLDEEATIPVIKFQPINVVKEFSMDSTSDGKRRRKMWQGVEVNVAGILNVKSCRERCNSMDGIAEDTGNKCASSISTMSFQVESLDSSMLREVVFDIKIENQTPHSLTAVTGCSGRADP
ncbi:hypothetical protein Fmac_023788 [Flemingia macrophylla]|uniref:Uncharacterized protein n=1 Tax=Flemingia macrophylla TaxID=520843 RepID=A0ABD1LMI8_9FABA